MDSHVYQAMTKPLPPPLIYIQILSALTLGKKRGGMFG